MATKRKPASEQEHSEETCQIVSHTPGRLRLRVKSAKAEQALNKFQASLGDQEGISQVETNSSTGSVLVRYDQKKLSHDDILGIFHDVGMIAADLGGGESTEGGEGGHSSTAGAIIAAVDDMDRRLSDLTGRKIDLRLAVPFALGGAGVILALARGGLGFTQVPPFLLLWYAWDSFLQLHKQTHVPPTDSQAGPGSEASSQAESTAS